MTVTLNSKVPDWDIHGVLPPVRPGATPVSSDRSPYRTSSEGLCWRFGQTAERRSILRGFINLRAELRQAGLSDGFQWVDGSFAEDVEASRGRPPGDIDVVTFVPLGDVMRQQQLVATYPDLLDPRRAKASFLVDHYIVATDVTFDADQAGLVAYWYSMWSHRRDDRRWKGFLQISLAEDDAGATTWLSHHDQLVN